MWWVLLAFLGLILFFFTLWKIPQWQLPKTGLELKDRIDLEIKARSTLAQIIAGSLFLLTAYSTWNSIEVSRRALQISQEGQITDRFATAVGLLGAKDEQGGNALPKRLGGIFALERIANESPRDYWPIIEVLTGFVREKAPRDMEKERKEGADVFGGGRAIFQPAGDIQAVLTVLKRRSRYHGNGEDLPLDLSASDLRGTYLQDTHLEKAFLFAANLSSAFLTNSQLQGANLAFANLENASLEGANLEGAYLDDANLRGARYSESTRWPVGFNPEERGAILTKY